LSIDEKIAEVQAKLTATAATPDTSNKALRQLQDLKTRVASQTSIAQILYLQGQGGDAMDEAITLIEAAAAAVAKPAHVAEPGNTTKPVQTGQPNVPPPVAKTTRVVRAAELSTKKYLETKRMWMLTSPNSRQSCCSHVRAGHIARIAIKAFSVEIIVIYCFH
jgi:hypothetical protein